RLFAAAYHADVHRRLPEYVVRAPVGGVDLRDRRHHLVDGRLAALRICGVAGNAFETDDAGQRPFRGARELRLRRLADDDVLRSELVEGGVRALRADGVRLFADHEEIGEITHPAGAQLLARGQHGGDHAL